MSNLRGINIVSPNKQHNLKGKVIETVKSLVLAMGRNEVCEVIFCPFKIM